MGWGRVGVGVCMRLRVRESMRMRVRVRVEAHKRRGGRRQAADGSALQAQHARDQWEPNTTNGNQWEPTGAKTGRPKEGTARRETRE